MRKTNSGVKQLTRDPRAEDFPEAEPLTQRDVDQNYGGDRVKATMLQAIESRQPLTHIYLELGPEAMEAHRSRKYGKFDIRVLVISGAGLYEAVQNETAAVPDGIEISGEKDAEERPVVRVTTEAGLKHLIDRVLAYRVEREKTRPYTRQDAMDAITDVKRRLGELKSKNSSRNFSGADAAFTEAQGTFAQNNFRKDRDTLDWGPVVKAAYRALEQAQSVVQEWMKGQALAMVGQLKRQVDTTEVEAQIEEASAPDADKESSIGRLWAIIKGLELGGASIPAYTRQGMGNRPESTGGSHDPNRGRRDDNRGGNTGRRGDRFQPRDRR